MSIFEKILGKLADKIKIYSSSKKNKSTLKNSPNSQITQILNSNIKLSNPSSSGIIEKREKKLNELNKMLWDIRRDIFSAQEMSIPPNQRIDISQKLEKIRIFFLNDFYFCSKPTKEMFNKLYYGELQIASGEMISLSFRDIDTAINELITAITNDLK